MTTLPTILLAAVVVGVCIADGETGSGARAKRGGNMGLFPFPRVGRAMNNEIAWANGYPDIHKYHQLRTRQGLMPFPRVGRGGEALWEASMQENKRDSVPGSPSGGASGGAGLWFGPRLGRLHKRSDGVIVEVPWGLIAVKDPTISLREADFTPRLGRESEEDENDDTVIEEVLSSRHLDSKNRNNLTQQ